MFDLKVNFNDFIKQIEIFLLDTKNYERSVFADGPARYWPKIRDRMRLMAMENFFDFGEHAPVRTYWLSFKKKNEGVVLRGEPHYTTERFPGQYFPITDHKDWFMTGQMYDTIEERLFSDSGRVLARGNEVELSIGVEVGDMVHDEDYRVPYPIAVDEKIMGASGEQIGVVRLTEDQASDILEALMLENEKLFNDIFMKK